MTGYRTPARLFHWIVALLVLATIPAGQIMIQDGLSRPVQNALFIFHKNVGVVILLVVLARLAPRARPVADLAAAYLPGIASTSGTGDGLPDDETDSALGVDIKRNLRALAGDEAASDAARERARAVLRRFKRAVLAAAADRDVEYVYVRWPADYTESREE